MGHMRTLAAVSGPDWSTPTLLHLLQTVLVLALYTVLYCSVVYLYLYYLYLQCIGQSITDRLPRADSVRSSC